MTRALVDSSNIHSVGHDETGLEVQFHAKGCGRALRYKADDPRRVCNCKGGEVWHYPGVPAETHQLLMTSHSIGSAFHEHVKAAKHPETRGLRYPGRLIAGVPA